MSLSTIGKVLAENPARIDMELFMDAVQNTYDAELNPGGAFPLNVAENMAICEVMRNELERLLQEGNIPEWVMKYTHPLGHPEVREIMAAFMRKYFGSEAIVADNLVFSAGASASLEACSFGLANPGDVVVIPAPCYPMYTHDLGTKTRMERYDLQTHVDIAGQETLALVTIEHLEKALADIQSAGKVFRILLITTPDNPTGSIYSATQLQEIANWCMQQKIHLVVNEIYALSPIDTSQPEIAADYPRQITYSSFSKIMAKENSDYLHLIYALSKDFAMSGLRFGILHTLNQPFLKALDGINIQHMVSNLTQWLIGNLFQQEKFIEEYIRENKKRITENYVEVVKMLKSLALPYTPARGSLFVWADFSKYLSAASDEAEMELWMEIYKNSGVLLTPGAGFQHQKKGIFRIVHTAMVKEDLVVGLLRLEQYLASR